MIRIMRALTLCVFALAAVAQAADIGISPPRLELSGSPGQTLTATVTVLTSAASEQQIAADVSDWTMDAAGNLIFFPPGSLPFSASPWLALDATDFILAPRGNREVRLALTIPDDAEGTFNSMVFFTVVPPPGATQGVGVVTTTRVGLTVYVTVAGTERGGSELLDFYRRDARTLTAVIANSGNTVMRLSGVIELRDESGRAVHRLDVPDVPVLRDSERELTLALPEDLAPGFYVALALIQDSRGGLLAGELPLEVP
jgi:hypothetical protein